MKIWRFKLEAARSAAASAVQEAEAAELAQLRRDNKRLTEEVEVLRVNRLSILIFHADQHAALLRQAGWHANDKRIERLWKREGLKVPGKTAQEGPAVVQRRLVCPAST